MSSPGVSGGITLARDPAHYQQLDQFHITAVHDNMRRHIRAAGATDDVMHPMMLTAASGQAFQLLGQLQHLQASSAVCQACNRTHDYLMKHANPTFQNC